MFAGGIDGLGLAVVAQRGLDIGMREEVPGHIESLGRFPGDRGDGDVAEEMRVDRAAEGDLGAPADRGVDRVGAERAALRRQPQRLLLSRLGEEQAVVFKVPGQVAASDSSGNGNSIGSPDLVSIPGTARMYRGRRRGARGSRS